MEVTGGIETGGSLAPARIDKLEQQAVEAAIQKANKLQTRLGSVEALPSQSVKGRGGPPPAEAQFINRVALRQLGG